MPWTSRALFGSLLGLLFCSFAEVSMAAPLLPSATVNITSYAYTKNDEVIAEVGGSGTIISADGLILSNNHVVEKDDDEAYDIFEICLSFTATEEPKCEYTADLIGRNREMDVSLLQLHPVDIRGKSLPPLKALDYRTAPQAKEGDTIHIAGFPGIGLDTITLTKGQVSGFEEINGFKYIKTDTEIAPGNSGGTALDAEGNFLGIPTYGFSVFGSSLGYFLDIAEARDWIDQHRTDSILLSPLGEKAREQLTAKLLARNDAEAENTYTTSASPRFTLRIPEDWEFAALERHLTVVRSKNEIANYQLSISVQESPFTVTPEYLEKAVFTKLEKNKENYNNYQRTTVDFHGVEAAQVSYLSGDQKTVHFVIPYGGAIFFLSYEYDLKKADAALKAYSEILENFTFVDAPKAPEIIKSLRRENPAFAIKTAPGWYLLENHDPSNEDLIVQFLRPDEVEGEISLSHFELSEADRELSAKDLLRQMIDELEFETGFRIISSNAEVVIDGLPGVALTYTYEGEDLGKARQASRIILRDGVNGYFFQYDDLDTNYERFLPDFIQILKSFQNLNPEAGPEVKGIYRIGSLSAVFKDVSYHRYEQAIAKLADEGIVDGYRDHTFRPERLLGRGEALKILIGSKVAQEERQDRTDLSDELQAASQAESRFTDAAMFGDLRQFITWAETAEVIRGYDDRTFRAETSVSIAELLKMLFTLYDIPTWQPLNAPDLPWYKPYLDKGFELGLVPYGIYEADHRVTRGEAAYMIATFLEQLENAASGF